MTDGRTRILQSITRSLGRGPLPPDRVAELDARLHTPCANTIPARSRLPKDEQIALFLRLAEAQAATVVRARTLDEVPTVVTGYLTQEGLPPEVVTGPDPQLAAVPWGRQPGLRVRTGPIDDRGLTAVTGVFAAIAETGTLVLVSGADTPTGYVFLPDTHIALVRADQVVGPFEDAWRLLRAARPDPATGFMPRTVNFVTGPSRTGDIEAVMYLGAHGPRRLHIIVVG